MPEWNADDMAVPNPRPVSASDDVDATDESDEEAEDNGKYVRVPRARVRFVRRGVADVPVVDAHECQEIGADAAEDAPPPALRDEQAPDIDGFDLPEIPDIPDIVEAPAVAPSDDDMDAAAGAAVAGAVVPPPPAPPARALPNFEAHGARWVRQIKHATGQYPGRPCV